MKKIDKKIDKIVLFLPLGFSLLLAKLNLCFNLVSSTLPGLDKVLESVITFTSIIIGILIALFGVVVTLTDKDIMKKLQKETGDRTIFMYSLETLLTNFVVLILSIAMQSIIEFNPSLLWVDSYIDIWLFFVLFSLLSSIRTIYYLLLISFNQDNKGARPKSTLPLKPEKRMTLRARKTPPQK